MREYRVTVSKAPAAGGEGGRWKGKLGGKRRQGGGIGVWGGMGGWDIAGNAWKGSREGEQEIRP
jgi:hypothetical protein